MNLNPLVAAAALLSTAVMAQANPTTETPRVDARQAHQEARIAQGAASGALTAREQHRLRRQQNAIAHGEAHAKADGNVTRAERRALHHAQRHASHNIARQKHDAQGSKP